MYTAAIVHVSISISAFSAPFPDPYRIWRLNRAEGTATWSCHTVYNATRLDLHHLEDVDMYGLWYAYGHRYNILRAP